MTSPGLRTKRFKIFEHFFPKKFRNHDLIIIVNVDVCHLIYKLMIKQKSLQWTLDVKQNKTNSKNLP